MIPLGLLPTIFGITGIISGAVAVLCAILFLPKLLNYLKIIQDPRIKDNNGSFIYLPIVQISFILDKYKIMSTTPTSKILRMNPRIFMVWIFMISISMIFVSLISAYIVKKVNLVDLMLIFHQCFIILLLLFY